MTKNNELTLVEDWELELKQNDLANVKDIQDDLLPFFQEAKFLEAEAMKIQVQSENDKESMQKARELRLNLQKIRVSADKKRKELKEESLRRANAVQGMFNIIKYLIVPLEEHLSKQEKYAEEMAKQRIEKLKIERASLLAEYEVDLTFVKVEEMPDEVFNEFLEKAKKEYVAKKNAEKEAEKQRLKEEKAKEKERLKALQVAKELKEKNDKLEMEKKRIEAELAQAQKRQDEEALKEKAREAKKQGSENMKLQFLLDQLERIEFPEMETAEYREMVKNIEIAVSRVVRYTRNHIKENQLT